MNEDTYIDDQYEDNLEIDQDYWDNYDEYYDDDISSIENADLQDASFYDSISVSDW